MGEKGAAIHAPNRSEESLLTKGISKMQAPWGSPTQQDKLHRKETPPPEHTTRIPALSPPPEAQLLGIPGAPLLRASTPHPQEQPGVQPWAYIPGFPRPSSV